MSNPCINRWGLNSFWHNFWHSDSRYALMLQQDKAFTTLVQLYFKYGTVFASTFGHSTFWYKTGAKPSPLDLNYYYRWVTIKGTDQYESYTARLRLTSAESFQTRVSILRYDSWFIINLYWFQPDKLKNKRDKRSLLTPTVIPYAAIPRPIEATTRLQTLLRKAAPLQFTKSTPYNF